MLILRTVACLYLSAETAADSDLEPIVSTSSPTCSNTYIVCSFSSKLFWSCSKTSFTNSLPLATELFPPIMSYTKYTCSIASSIKGSFSAVKSGRFQPAYCQCCTLVLLSVNYNLRLNANLYIHFVNCRKIIIFIKALIINSFVGTFVKF